MNPVKDSTLSTAPGAMIVAVVVAVVVVAVVVVVVVVVVGVAVAVAGAVIFFFLRRTSTALDLFEREQ